MFNFLIRKWVKNPEDTASPAVRTAYGKLSGAVGIALNFLLFAVCWASSLRKSPPTKSTLTAMDVTNTWPA